VRVYGCVSLDPVSKLENDLSTLNSYLGLLKHGNAKKLQTDIKSA